MRTSKSGIRLPDEPGAAHSPPGAAQRRIDGNADAAAFVDREPAHDRIDVAVEHAQHRLAGLHPECRERMGQACAKPVDFGVGMKLAAEVQQYPVGVSRDCAIERRDYGAGRV
jgi:hypothetical protein